jgi:hypothetical protein
MLAGAVLITIFITPWCHSSGFMAQTGGAFPYHADSDA